jgi:tetratricopeptide (TPR) repeat protein
MFALRSLFAAFRHRRSAITAYERGIAALEAGRAADALAAFDVACVEAATSGERSRAHNKRGVACVELGRPDEALAAFEEALGHDERSAAALVNLGNLLLEAGHELDAIDYYRGAARADETYALAERNLGVALKRLGRHAEAVRALRTAARLEGRRRA